VNILIGIYDFEWILRKRDFKLFANILCDRTPPFICTALCCISCSPTGNALIAFRHWTDLILRCIRVWSFVPHKTPIIAGLLVIARSYCWKQTDVFNKFPAPHFIWAQVVHLEVMSVDDVATFTQWVLYVSLIELLFRKCLCLCELFWRYVKIFQGCEDLFLTML